MFIRAISLCALAAACGTAAGQNLLNNPGFETGTAAPSNPAFPVGSWSFDNHSFVTATQGITPWQGQRMLRFNATSPAGPSGLLSCDVVQVVDVSTGNPALKIATGSAMCQASIRVNRVVAQNVDTGFVLIVLAHSSLNDAQNLWNPIAQGSFSLQSDSNLGSWQTLSTSFALPTATQYLSFRISAVENVLNDVVGKEFAGHFADNGRLRVVLPAPGSLVLAGLGGLAVFRRRR